MITDVVSLFMRTAECVDYGPRLGLYSIFRGKASRPLFQRWYFLFFSFYFYLGSNVSFWEQEGRSKALGGVLHLSSREEFQ